MKRESIQRVKTLLRPVALPDMRTIIRGSVYLGQHLWTSAPIAT